MIKPDAIEQGLATITEIISAYSESGLIVKRVKYFRMTQTIFNGLYGQYSNKEWFDELLHFYLFKMFIAIDLEGENAVSRVRMLNGDTDPDKAGSCSLRGRFGAKEKGPCNAVHASDSVERACVEISLIWSR
jgi:nucleoside-diphosphate kinase